MRDLIVGPGKSVFRILAQVRKELIQVRRRPGAFFSLVLGPFLIMAVFGLGYTGVERQLNTVIVVPPELNLPRDVAYYQGLAGPAFDIVEVADSADQAKADLAAQKLDLIVIAPADAVQKIQAGQQATIEIDMNSVNPAATSYAGFVAQVFNEKINEEIVKQAVAEGENLSNPANVPIPGAVVAAPTTVVVNNVAPSNPGVLGFAAPAVLALMLQHMAVTLTALSFIRERTSGTLELFRVSPVNSFELVLGKYLGLGLVSAIVAAVSGLLLVTVLGVPLLGPPIWVAIVIGLLVFASLGIGLIISVISDSERQAVQIALLLLLASVFFSGFVLPVDQFRDGVQYLAYALPVTHGIRLLQDFMLRGSTTADWQITLLLALGLIFLLLNVVLLRRQMRNA